MRTRAHALAALVALAVRPVVAQSIRGVVRDSASGAPVPGAIITLLDSAGSGMTRNLSNERGLYVARRFDGARRIRVVRLGFRPREVALPDVQSDIAADVTLDVTLQSIPFLLSTRRVMAARSCPRRADTEQALGLLEQARAGLLATVVARSETPARMTRLTFRRILDDSSGVPTRQTVHVDTTTQGTTSFDAARDGGEFVRAGFLRDSAGSQYFLAPDAETLLDDEFAAGYCFRIMPSDSARRSQVGLGFAPGGGRRPRVEIEGALWIDTVARSLVDIQFRYIGLDQGYAALRPGGRVGFRDMPDGTAVVDQWTLRLVGSRPDTLHMPRGSLVRVASRRIVQEGGGELAQAAWPDGRTWNASLGTLRLQAVRAAGGSAPGVVVQLDDTDYTATTDSMGVATFNRLVPGPYALSVVDPRMAKIGIALRTPVEFTVQRGESIARTFVVPSVEDLVATRCQAARQFSSLDSVWVVGRVVGPDESPVPGASVTLAEVVDGKDVKLPMTYTTSGDGVFQFCRGLRSEVPLHVRATAPGRKPFDIVLTLEPRLTITKVVVRE